MATATWNAVFANSASKQNRFCAGDGAGNFCPAAGLPIGGGCSVDVNSSCAAAGEFDAPRHREVEVKRSDTGALSEYLEDAYGIRHCGISELDMENEC